MRILKKLAIGLLVVIVLVVAAGWWVLRGGEVVAVIDLDSPRTARFDAADRAGLEALAALIAARI